MSNNKNNDKRVSSKDLEGVAINFLPQYYGLYTDDQVMRNLDRVLNIQVGEEHNLRWTLDKFTEMIEKDTLIGHCYDMRSLIIRSFNYELLSEDESPKGIEIKEFVYKNLFENINFDTLLRQLLFALVYGYIIIEKLFEMQNNKLELTGFTMPFPGFFAFNTDYDLLYYPDGVLIGTPQNITQEGKRDKFLVWSYNSKFGNPYGKSILDASVYYLYLFSKETKKLWYSFIAKYGNPFLYGSYTSTNATEEQKKAFAELVGKLRAGLSIALPDYMEIKSIGDIDVHENSTVFKDFWQMSSIEIANRLVFQTMSAEAEKYGSYAKNKVYQNIMEMAFHSDSIELAEVINHQLIRHLVIYNYGEQELYPYINFSVNEIKNMEGMIKVLVELDKMGLSIPEDYLREFFNIPPVENEDDAVQSKKKPESSDSEDDNKIIDIKEIKNAS